MSTQTLSKIGVDFTFVPVLNYAMQQNHVPVISQLIIHNTSDVKYEDLSVVITTSPEFAVTWRGQTGFLPKDDKFSFGVIPINVSIPFLADLTERMICSFSLQVLNDADILFEAFYPIDLLAYDQWNGAGQLPELLAAFVTPNHPEIPSVIRKASVILEKWTGNPSFNEYQSRNPDRVRKQMAAIYEAISEKQLIYCTSPASFETSGQRVRLTDTIFLQGLANCLDLSLLFAACLEAVGINPLIIIVKDHAFVGAWLVEESFADSVNDDPSLITKRMVDGISEITVVEATCMNAGNQTPFDDAVRSAELKMIDTSNFLMFIDVKRARFANVRPLPLRRQSPTGWEIIETAQPKEITYTPEEITFDNKPVYSDKIAVSKQQIWERKLLDLTLRNTLLNVRMTKSIIQFMTVSAGKLEDELAGGKEFQVLAKPSDWENTLRDEGIYESIHSSNPIAELVSHELTHQRLRTYLTETELNYSLTALFRSSRLAMEENGANTLYVGIGLLKWFETEASEKPRYAPILLVPVEIIRKSAQRGYIIRSREEETIINITMLEKLRQDFGISIGGLESLPKDDSGVDVRAILNTIRQCIMSKARWDVEDQSIIGNFSFSKFILWNDIHNNSDKLAKNKVVASLVSGILKLNAEDLILNENVADDSLHPSKLALPISTDSSQLQAILSSGEGKSFVLHGPPGTGKSQTITNIIANALYAGKKVLFVSAKKAALEVVQKRLESIGIGDFCLELHSNKSKKTEVLSQLKKAAEVSNKSSSTQFQANADRLFELRKDLNSYVESLHKRHPFGYSLFDLFTAYAQLEDTPDIVYFPAALLDNLSEQKLTAWKDLAEDLQSVAQFVPEPGKHPLKAFQLQSYSPLLKNEARKQIEEIKALLIKLEAAVVKATVILNLDGLVVKHEQVESLVELSVLLLKLPDSPGTFLTTDAPEQTFAQIIGIAEHGLKRDQIRAELLKTFNAKVLTFSAQQALTDWNIASEKWFLPKWMKHRAIAKIIKSRYVLSKIQNDDIPGLLETIISFQEEQKLIDQASYLPALLGFLWNNGECNWGNIQDICNGYINLNRAAYKITGLQELKSWREKLAAKFTEGSKLFVQENIKQLNDLGLFNEQVNTYRQQLGVLLGIDFTVIDKQQGPWIKTLITQCDEWLNGLDSLKDWYNYTSTRQLVSEIDLQPLTTAFEEGLLKHDEIVKGYFKGFYKSAAEMIIEQHIELATFNGQLFEGKIKKFREISREFGELTKSELYARLAAKIPSFTQEAAQSSEIGILQRTLRNNGRALPIRTLFQQISNLLPKLAPCMLMSPISVAQYFDTNSAKFDLVIFDEASQMPTCEAVGTIARGNSLIVVGDPKQMPPTNFFSTNNIDEDNIEKEDLESILDDCLALSMPSHHLRWHYRSKHESLIAFSNAKYYENKLLTFPSTDDLTSRVKLVKVKGFYDKGNSRQNKSEAKAIVDYIIYRLSDKNLSKRSLGVVTFSSVQQTLIEDMLTEVFALRPDLEKIAYDTEEPIFIKNLENVQGDERDIILFSIGYGPDQHGKVSLNFGPINRDGGWRRLNVAVSRARYEMKVFSTLSSDQIDLNRTGSEGVAGLKAFLAYAEKGIQALPIRSKTRDGSTAGLEEVIAAEVRKHGYKVNTSIGCSAFKIDIGVVHPEYPDHYLLAILLDGKTYHAASTSSDREIVQAGVLKGLGWNILKVWSTEWWENEALVLQNILAAIHRVEKGIIAETKAETVVLESHTLNSIVMPEEIPTDPVHSKISNRIEYEATIVEIVPPRALYDIFSYGNRTLFKNQIQQVIDKEAPISKCLLCKRVLTAWGSPKLASRLTAHFESLFDELNLKPAISEDIIVFWKEDLSPDNFLVYRIPPNENLKRDADDLPAHEVANGIKDILQNQISLLEQDLIKEAARVFGYARIGTNVENAMRRGIKQAVQNGYAKMDGGRVVHKE